jgi:hypothetical protein
MAFNELVTKAQTYFPNIQIKYKNENTFMRILGTLLFFNPAFMKSFSTTIGNTIYWPSREYVQNNSKAVSLIFIHECTHMYDEKKIGSVPYKLGYLFPQILALPMMLLLFLLNWKIVALLAVLCLLPLPAPFRARVERRGYFTSMLVGYKLYGQDPGVAGAHYTANFRNSTYYWMMPFGQDKLFVEEAVNVKANKPSASSDPELLKMINDLISVAK